MFDRVINKPVQNLSDCSSANNISDFDFQYEINKNVALGRQRIRAS